MNPSVKAILARCGSTFDALIYCRNMAKQYPRLAAEYNQYFAILQGETVSLQDLVGLAPLPANTDSVSYVRSLRDAREDSIIDEIEKEFDAFVEPSKEPIYELPADEFIKLWEAI